jgi:flavorubredoxin
MTTIDEIAPDIFGICTYLEQSDLQFRQFLIHDEQPLLYHTGPRRTFERVRDAVGQVLDPGSLRWIAFSHFEADECGALNFWLQEAAAQAACSTNGALVSIGDFAFGKVRPLGDGETLTIGAHRLRFLATPHLPHGWDAGHLYDETAGVLFCEFTLKFALPSPDVDVDDCVERLGSCGCDNAIVGIGQKGRIALRFMREADSAEQAVLTGITDRSSACLHVRDVERECRS